VRTEHELRKKQEAMALAEKERNFQIKMQLENLLTERMHLDEQARLARLTTIRSIED